MADIAQPRDEARRNTRARFEQWAKNPTCGANTLSAVHNVRMDAAAKQAGLKPSFGQSPFAITRGNRFEAGLFTNNASKIRSALERKGCLPVGSSGFLDLRLRMNGGSRLNTADEALGDTERWLQRLASDPAAAETIVAAPMIRIPKGVILPEALLIVDVVTVVESAGVAHLTVGEVKVFPDRGGHTDAHQIASARAQAGVYRHAFLLAVENLGLRGRIEIASDGLLVFTWPGSNAPAIRAGEDLTYQTIRAQRGFEHLEEVAQQFVRDDDFAADNPALVQRVLDADTDYSEVCLSFCDLAPRCHARALATGDAVVLGDDVKQLLGDVTIARAIELIGGAKPANDREGDLQRQLRT